jgi:abhydrolase domain-containing protein 12
VDGASVYAWHILPLPLYAANEEKIIEQPSGKLVEDFSKSESYRLLKEDPKSRVVIYCEHPKRTV